MSLTQLQAARLARLITGARVRKGISLRSLSKQTGIPLSSLNALELGAIANPPTDRLLRLAEALDIPPSRLDSHMRAIGEQLPDVRTYFRAKFALSARDAERMERYVTRYLKEQRSGE
jgi:transcriptional regulator with XRE-family HTH domain